MVFRRQIGEWFEALGFDFLDVVQREIIRLQIVDTRLLLNSFQKGGKDNVFEASSGGLVLEVGTNVEYARFVNDGHYLNPQGVSTRFVPGDFQGSRFVYRRGASTGIVLRQRFIPGRHYWERANTIFRRIFDASLDNRIQEWLNEFFT